MIDLKTLRENFDTYAQLLAAKDPTFPLLDLLKRDEQVRELKRAVEDLRQKKNELAVSGARALNEHIREASKKISSDLKEKEQQLRTTEASYKQLLLSCPNIPASDLPRGDKADNKVIRVAGATPSFSFEPQRHTELNRTMQWFDFETASTMSGSHFVLYKGDAVKLIYALTQLMIKHNKSYGFEPVLPPYLVKEKALENSGNLPKFQGDYYQTDEDKLCLIPTAEVSITNMHADTIFHVHDLPKRYTAWTSCFRREAGGYGAQDRGLIRVHQFEKVEIYSFCEPQRSDEELEYMLSVAEDFLQKLGLHYRVTLLATQDCSFSAARTYDLEVWLAGQKAFYEVSSLSNCTDFQARRARIRYRLHDSKKTNFVHTLNGSSLAIPRLIVALMEHYQQEDGSVIIPGFVQEQMNVWW